MKYVFYCNRLVIFLQRKKIFFKYKKENYLFLCMHFMFLD